MKLESLTPNLMVDDVNETIDWYAENLGFKRIMSVPEEGRFQWAMIGRDGVNLMLQTRESIAEEDAELGNMPIGGSLSFFVRMNGLEALYDNITHKQAVIKPPYKTFYGMMEMMVKDCNGYYLTFAEEVPGSS